MDTFPIDESKAQDLTDQMQNHLTKSDAIVIREHAIMVGNLAKPGVSILESLTPKKCHALHMAIGISSEVDELTEALYKYHKELQNPGIFPPKDHLKEELGDLMFYMVGYELLEPHLRNVFAETVDHQIASSLDIDEFIVRLNCEAGDFLDLVAKKLVIYNKPESDELLTRIARAYTGICELVHYACRQLDLYWVSVLYANEVKLVHGKNARYKDGTYSDEAAQARADKPIGE